jgi:2-phospho-L-lactate guanylyltransferase
VKRLERAKTRLAVDEETRLSLALAMALDSVRACVAAQSVSSVVVVTDDDRVRAAFRALPVVLVPDEPDAGLNPALSHGAAVAASVGHATGVVALSSDLPAATAPDLDALLAYALEVDCAVVADAAGTGTTVLAAADVRRFDPQFGPDSLRRHISGGAKDLSDRAAAGLRRDVDTLADLAGVIALGCGPATMQAARAAELAAP